MTRLSAAIDGKGEISFSGGRSANSDTPPASAPSPVTEKDPKGGGNRRSGAGALTGLLGIVCALLGVVSAPSLFLPLAVAFSAFSLLRSLAVLSVLGTVAAALSCILTVVGLVLFPWGTEESGRAAAAAASSAMPAPAKPASVSVVPTKPAEPEAATGALSMPPPPAPKSEAAPSPSKSEAAPPAEGKPAPAPPSSAASSEGPAVPRLEDALPKPPPPAAAVVPDMPTSTPTPLEAEKPAEEPKAKAVAMQPWPESRTEQTKAIQILLRDLDFYHGTTNGTFGPATRAAICLYLVTYDEKGECEPSQALFESLQKRRAATNVGSVPH